MSSIISYHCFSLYTTYRFCASLYSLQPSAGYGVEGEIAGYRGIPFYENKLRFYFQSHDYNYNSASKT